MSATCSKDSTNMRIVLLGTPGAGKSATGNTILGREVFREETGAGKSPHVFLLVIRLETFTQEDRNALSWIQKNFGEEALSYTMVLFTGREKLTRKQWDDFERTETTKQPISVCGERYYALNSKPEVYTTQVTELLRKIEEMVERNGGGHYLEERYQEAQRKIREEQEREKKIEERKREERKREEEKREEQKREEQKREEQKREEQKREEQKREEQKKIEERKREEQKREEQKREEQKREEQKREEERKRRK